MPKERLQADGRKGLADAQIRQSRSCAKMSRVETDRAFPAILVTL